MTPPSETSQRKVSYRRCMCSHHRASGGHTFGSDLRCRNKLPDREMPTCGKTWRQQQRSPTTCKLPHQGEDHDI